MVPVKSSLELCYERLGPLPIINHFLGRLGLDDALADSIPSQDRDTGLPYVSCLTELQQKPKARALTRFDPPLLTKTEPPPTTPPNLPPH